MNPLKDLLDMLMALKEKGAEELVKLSLELLAEPLGYKITSFDAPEKEDERFENDVFEESLSKKDKIEDK